MPQLKVVFIVHMQVHEFEEVNGVDSMLEFSGSKKSDVPKETEASTSADTTNNTESTGDTSINQAKTGEEADKDCGNASKSNSVAEVAAVADNTDVGAVACKNEEPSKDSSNAINTAVDVAVCSEKKPDIESDPADENMVDKGLDSVMEVSKEESEKQDKKPDVGSDAINHEASEAQSIVGKKSINSEETPDVELSIKSENGNKECGVAMEVDEVNVEAEKEEKTQNKADNPDKNVSKDVETMDCTNGDVAICKEKELSPVNSSEAQDDTQVSPKKEEINPVNKITDTVNTKDISEPSDNSERNTDDGSKADESVLTVAPSDDQKQTNKG